MNAKTKVRKIGNSLGIILPKEVVDALMVQEGATLYMTKAPDNRVNLAAETDDLAETMDVANECIRRYRNALRELAK